MRRRLKRKVARKKMMIKSNVTRWLILACIYVAWNFNAYLSSSIYGWHVKWYTYSYWLWERFFVIGVFWAILPIVEKPYRWVIKTFIWIAAWKFLYTVLVVAEVIKKNDFASLMGVLFIIVIGVISLIWERRRSKYY